MIVSDFSTSPAWGTGLATVTADGRVLDVWYPTGRLGLGTAPADDPGFDPTLTTERPLPGLRSVETRTTVASLAEPPADAADALAAAICHLHRARRGAPARALTAATRGLEALLAARGRR